MFQKQSEPLTLPINITNTMTFNTITCSQAWIMPVNFIFLHVCKKICCEDTEY